MITGDHGLKCDQCDQARNLFFLSPKYDHSDHSDHGLKCDQCDQAMGFFFKVFAEVSSKSLPKSRPDYSCELCSVRPTMLSDIKVGFCNATGSLASHQMQKREGH